MNGSVNVPGYTAEEVTKIVEDFKKLLADYAPAAHDHLRQILKPSSVELIPQKGATNGGTLDFHYGGDETKDYTTRLIEGAEGMLSIMKAGAGTDNGPIPGVRTVSLSLTAGGWSNLQQTKTAQYVTADNVVIAAPAPASVSAWRECGVRCTAQAAGKLTFACDSKPTVSIAVNVLLLTV